MRACTLMSGRRYSFGCRYRLGTASNLVMYVSAADNDYVGVTGTFLGTALQGVWSTARLDFSALPGGIAKLHFGAFGSKGTLSVDLSHQGHRCGRSPRPEVPARGYVHMATDFLLRNQAREKIYYRWRNRRIRASRRKKKALMWKEPEKRRSSR